MSIFTPRIPGKKELSLANDLVHEGKLEEAMKMAKTALVEIRKRGKVKEIISTNARVVEIQAIYHEHEGNLDAASGAYGQSAKFYLQSDMLAEFRRVQKKHAELLLDVGRNHAAKKAFDSAASSFEEAAISYKLINLEIDAIEAKAKAFVFRAASVRNPPDRKRFLMRAVDLIRESGINHPLVFGHLEYYTALVQRISSPELAIESLKRAYTQYKTADSKAMQKTVQAMVRSLQKEINQL